MIFIKSGGSAATALLAIQNRNRRNEVLGQTSFSQSSRISSSYYKMGSRYPRNFRRWYTATGRFARQRVFRRDPLLHKDETFLVRRTRSASVCLRIIHGPRRTRSTCLSKQEETLAIIVHIVNHYYSHRKRLHTMGQGTQSILTRLIDASCAGMSSRTASYVLDNKAHIAARATHTY